MQRASEEFSESRATAQIVPPPASRDHDPPFVFLGLLLGLVERSRPRPLPLDEPPDPEPALGERGFAFLDGSLKNLQSRPLLHVPSTQNLQTGLSELFCLWGVGDLGRVFFRNS